jgi:alkyldihydroxyacetonephosphate synthase
MFGMRRHWGWGHEEDRPPENDLRAAAAAVAERLGLPLGEAEAPAPVRLPPPRVATPPFATSDDHARALHAHGSSYLDVVRSLRGEFPHPPDAVALPRDEHELARVLEWCAAERLAVSPYGGGTSVVGGVDPIPGPGHAGAVSVDLSGMDRVLAVDATSRAARIQAGAAGPRLEQQLGAHGLTMRFYPQSFELSTLGGWIATRAAGHYATGPTHVDDLVESVRAITVSGDVWESRRLPASGAGPSPDRMLLGSEGTLAVITEAWVRVRERPAQRRGASVAFPSFAHGCEAVRALLQAGHRPANARLIDAREAELTFAGDGSRALLVLGYEDVTEPADAAFALCREHGGEIAEQGGGAGAWRQAFLLAPYVRDALVQHGILVETFETAITWERLPALIAGVQAALAGEAEVTCRLTHAYADGAAPYFTVWAPARRGEEAEQWPALKRAASDALQRAGGTITHHHAVGRDHRPAYDHQRPAPFAAAYRAAKTALDPDGLLNPGVLFEA